MLAEHDVGRIVEAARAERPRLVIVDSIQTATVDELDGAAGSVGQVREATLRLMDLAKGDGIAVVLVGHVTKDGAIAGPKTLEHLVDAVINLEGERYAALRLLRATKNRFGSTDEVGVFEMAETGLLEVADPARAFLADHGGSAPGQRRRADPRGQPAAARRGPGAGQPERLRHAVAQGQRRRREPAQPAHRGPRPASRGSPSAATTSTPTWPAGCRSPSRRSTCRSRSRWPRRRRDRPIAPGTVAIGEVGLLGRAAGGRRSRAPAARGRPARLRPRRSCRSPDGRGRRSRRSTASTIIRVGDPARRHRGRPGRPTVASWRGGPGDARLTARPGRSRPRDTGHCRGNR